MGCISPSVQDVADANINAKKAVERLQAALEAEKDSTKSKFFAEIDQSLISAKIADARQIDYNSNIKTEYTSEFSLDKVASIVTAALQAAIAAQDPLAPVPGTSPAALSAYTDVVIAVAEAAKSKSASAASLSFSMNRLSPGLFAFLYASSTNIKDEGLFGTETVVATAIFYRFMQSIDDIKNEAAFGEAVIDAKNLLSMKRLQAGLTERLAKGEITMNDWERLDGQFSGMITTIRDRLLAAGWPPEKFDIQSASDQDLVRTSIQALALMGSAVNAVVVVSKERLATNYY